MNHAATVFLDGRIDDILQTLKATNGEYALAEESRKNLYEAIEPIILHNKSITISAGDCLNFCDYFKQEDTVSGIIQHELYKQGYLDCVQLLSLLGALA